MSTKCPEKSRKNSPKNVEENYPEEVKHIGPPPPAPKVAAMKKTLYLVQWKKSRIFRDFFWQPFSMEIDGRKSAKKFAAFYADLLQTLTVVIVL